MITNYEIDGFRSLINFSIDLQPGLNILVGPNGAGKTNFLDFLDFIETTIRQNASSAVSSNGGVARVFSQEVLKKPAPLVRAKMRGTATIPKGIYRAVDYYFEFEYEVEIKFSKIYSSIYISKELIKFGKLYSRKGIKWKEGLAGTLTVTRKTPNPLVNPVMKFSKLLESNRKTNPLTLVNRISKRSLADNLKTIDCQALAPDETIFALRTMLPVFSAISLTISRGRSCNIIPEKVRIPDEIIKPPVIMRDGSGLSSTLYALKRLSQSRETTPRTRLRRATPSSLDAVIEWTKLVFPDLNSIDIDKDPHSGKYLAHLIVGNPPLDLSLQSASDGTLKWLCLVTLIVTSGSMYSVEEPENFLHPRMQEFLVYLIRESLEEEKDFFIMSTHSETLLNHCKPEEIVVFEFCHNKTTCSRILNFEQVQEEINKTGFGLGHYYASNALS